MTLQQMVEALEAALPLKQSDLDFIKQQISTAFTGVVQIEAHIQMQTENLSHLARAGQTVPPLDAVTLMWTSFSATSKDVEDFAAAKTQYLVQHGALDQQTPNTLAPFLISYVSQQLQHHRAANQALRAARTLAHTALVVPVNQPLAPPPPIAAPAVAIAQHNNQSGRGGRGGRGGTSGRTVGPPPVPLPGAPAFYCWTHGTCYHYSVTCKKPAAAHRWEATLVNQLGGTPA